MDSSERRGTDNRKTDTNSVSQTYRPLAKMQQFQSNDEKHSINSTDNRACIETTKQLIAEGALAEKEYGDLIDAALACKAEIDKKVIELRYALNALKSALKSPETPFMSVARIVDKLIEAHKDDADGVQEVSKYMQENH